VNNEWNKPVRRFAVVASGIPFVPHVTVAARPQRSERERIASQLNEERYGVGRSGT
jgi:hypothetical protein